MRPFLPSLLSSWLSDAATSPRLTWYGENSARIELSGKVLATSVFKAMQALEDLGDATTGTRVLLDLPLHWRALVWAFGVWTVGACLVLPGADDQPSAIDDEQVDVVITHRPEHWQDFAASGGIVFAQDLADLALRWGGEPLRPGIIDAAADVMTYPDQVPSVPIPLHNDPALVGQDGVIHFAGLPSWASGHNESRLMDSTHASAGNPSRIMASPTSLTSLLATAVAVYGNRGTLVLIAASLDDSTRQTVAHQEAISEVW